MRKQRDPGPASPDSPSANAAAKREPRARVALSLRWYLVALTSAVTLPLMALAIVEAWDAIQARQSEASLHMQLQLSESVQGVVQGVASMTAVAQVLAQSPALAARNLAAFRLDAEELAVVRGVDVVLRDEAGMQRVATRMPRGTPMPSLPPEDRQARAAVDRGTPYVSDVYSSGMTHPFLVRIVVPAIFGSGDAADKGYAVEVAIPPDTVSVWLDDNRLPQGWTVCVIGRNGQVVAHNGDSGPYVGRGTASEVFGELEGNGPWKGFDLDGKPLTGVYTRLPSGWIVAVGAPDQVLAQPLRVLFVWLGAVLALLILGGLTLSLLLVRRIDRSAATLEQAAWALGVGEAVPHTKLPVRDLAFVQHALASAGSDLAARRVTERQLLADVRTAHDLLQAVVDGSDDLIFARDGAGCVLLANQASAALFGLRSGTEAIGLSLGDMLSPASAAGLEAETSTESGVATIDGRLFEVGHSKLREPGGAAVGTISIAREVTKRVAEEARLQRLQADLARAGRLSAVAAMGAGLAHELHQPLSAAANFLAVAVRRLGTMNGPEASVAPAVADAMAEASGQVLRAGEIVQRLRGFIEEAEMQHTVLAPLLREAAEAAWQHSGPADGRIHIQLDERMQALVDPVSIQQVVSNLVRNAADALGPAGGDVWLLLDASEDGSAMISVLDTGGGIDPADADRLFDVFSGSSKKEGLGVGLAICRTIVAAHGGWITATNHAGGGAAFVFTLPPGPGTAGANPVHTRRVA